MFKNTFCDEYLVFTFFSVHNTQYECLQKMFYCAPKALAELGLVI
jgi:hypothetical protein